MSRTEALRSVLVDIGRKLHEYPAIENANKPTAIGLMAAGRAGVLEEITGMVDEALAYDKMRREADTSGVDHATLVNEMAEAAHDAWWNEYRRQGYSSRQAEWGEEFMVPFAQLSRRGQEFDRVIMRAILGVMVAREIIEEA